MMYLKEEPWKSHYQQFLFRVLDDDMAQQAEFDNWRQKLVQHLGPRLRTPHTKNPSEQLYSHEYGETQEMYGPAPFCIQCTVPELNIDLAKAQILHGENITPSKVFKMIRPQGVCVTPEDTMKLTDSGAAGQLRVLTVQGPAQIRNVFGTELEEGDQIWIQMKAVVVPTDPKYRINMDGQFIHVENKTGRSKMWQLHYYHGKTPPPREYLDVKYNRDTGKQEDCAAEYGYNFRIGTVQHIYQANFAPMSFLGVTKDNQQIGTFDNDLHAAHLAPMIRVFIDFSSNGAY
jgi:hypothetical protein